MCLQWRVQCVSKSLSFIWILTNGGDASISLLSGKGQCGDEGRCGGSIVSSDESEESEERDCDDSESVSTADCLGTGDIKAHSEAGLGSGVGRGGRRGA
jgi:hypothetical protein